MKEQELTEWHQELGKKSLDKTIKEIEETKPTFCFINLASPSYPVRSIIDRLDENGWELVGDVKKMLMFAPKEND